MREPTLVSAIQRPTILVDEERVRRNIQWMAEKAARGPFHFRPHFKTHQSAFIGNWFRDYGVKAITVSSVEMAAYFIQNGWRDITIAFPVNLRQIDLINELTGSNAINLLVESQAAAESLETRLTGRVGVWISIDAGYGREGRPFSDIQGNLALIKVIQASRRLHFKGLLAHFGNTYGCVGKESITHAYRASLAKLLSLKAELAAQGVSECQISVGDTPACSVVDDLSPVNEIRPGNFVFYDLTQWKLEACSEDQIAAVAACPVVGVYPERNTIALYGGAIHLSKDFVANPDGSRTYGRVARLTQTGWEPALDGTEVYSVSQEHGMIHAPAEICKQVQAGDLLAVLPAHICLTVSAIKRYQMLNGDKFEDCEC